MKHEPETEHVYPTIGVRYPVVTGPYRERVVRCRDCACWSGWADKVCYEWSEGNRSVITPPDGFCYLGDAGE